MNSTSTCGEAITVARLAAAVVKGRPTYPSRHAGAVNVSRRGLVSPESPVCIESPVNSSTRDTRQLSSHLEATGRGGGRL